MGASAHRDRPGVPAARAGDPGRRAHRVAPARPPGHPAADGRAGSCSPAAARSCSPARRADELRRRPAPGVPGARVRHRPDLRSVSVAAMADVAHESAGLASGLMTTAHELGAALGVAVLARWRRPRAGGRASRAATEGFPVAAGSPRGLALFAALIVPSVRPAAGHRRLDALSPASAGTVPGHARASRSPPRDRRAQRRGILDAVGAAAGRAAPAQHGGDGAEAGVSAPTPLRPLRRRRRLVEAAVERAVRVAPRRLRGGPARGRARRRGAERCSSPRGARWPARTASPAPPPSTSRAGGCTRSTRDVERLLQLIARGRRKGRPHRPPAEWLVRSILALTHAADDHARARGVKRRDALAHLEITIRDLVAPATMRSRAVNLGGAGA